MSELSELPSGFWLSGGLLLVVSVWSWSLRRQGWGLPAIGVCLTVLFWYHGDVIYNNYSENHALEFREYALESAWWQVSWFALSFGVLVGIVSNGLNRSLGYNSSRMVDLISGRQSLDLFRHLLVRFLMGVALVWGAVFCFALWRTDWNVLGLVAPYLGEMAYPWARGQLGTGGTDAFVALFANLNMLCAAMFGVFVALLPTGPARRWAIALMVLSWPSFFLDRSRNTMLVVLLPGLLAFTLLRLRARFLTQTLLLVILFVSLNIWFKFVVSNRSETKILSALLIVSKRSEIDPSEMKHFGLNMFEELCWVNTFIDSGSYTPDWGKSYLGELVNPIPRALWPTKPKGGFAYSLLRGQIGDEDIGISGTVSTGMIGGGVVNFGLVAGPVAAAFLMSLWCAFLARLDLLREEVGYFLVYLIGSVGIVNFGRDITLLAAYPALFGCFVVWAWRKVSPFVAHNADGSDADRDPT